MVSCNVACINYVAPPSKKFKKMCSEDASPIKVAIDFGFEDLMTDKVHCMPVLHVQVHVRMATKSLLYHHQCKHLSTISVYMYMYVCVYVHVHVHVCVCTCIHTLYACVCMCTYICVYVCICVCSYSGTVVCVMFVCGMLSISP